MLHLSIQQTAKRPVKHKTQIIMMSHIEKIVVVFKGLSRTRDGSKRGAGLVFVV